MILASGSWEDYVDIDDTSLGFKTFNDYLLTPEAISAAGSKLLNNSERAESTQKLTVGAIYVVEASGVIDAYKNVTKKQYRILIVKNH